MNNPTPAPRRRTSLLPLEDRILLAGDGPAAGVNASITADQADRLNAGLITFADWSGALLNDAGATDPLGLFADDAGDAITFAGLIDPSQVLSDLLVTPIADYFDNDASPTTDELVASLASVPGIEAIAGGRAGGATGELRVNLTLRHEVTVTDARLDLGEAGTDQGVTLGELAGLDATVALAFDGTIGLDLSATAGPAEAFFLRDACLDFILEADAISLAPQGTVGLLAVTGSNASVTGESRLRTTLADDDNQVTREDLQAGDTSAIRDVTVVSDSFAASIPLTANLTNWSPDGTPTLDVLGGALHGGTLLVTPDADFTDSLEAFARVDAGTVLAGLREAANAFTLLSLSDALAFDAPFVDTLRFGEAVSLGTMFNQGVVDTLADRIGLPGFTTAQDLAGLLNASELRYDAGLQRLLLPVDLQTTLPAITGVGLSPGESVLGDWVGDALAEMQRSAQFAMTIGIDLADTPDATPGDRILLDDAEVTGTLEPTADNLAGRANVGFLGIEFTDASIEGATSVTAELIDGPGGQGISVEDLRTALEPGGVFLDGALDFAGSTTLTLGGITIEESMFQIDAGDTFEVTAETLGSGVVETLLAEGTDNAALLEDFARLTPDALFDELQSVGGVVSGTLETVTNIAGIIPGVDEALLTDGLRPSQLVDQLIADARGLIPDLQLDTGQLFRVQDIPSLILDAAAAAGIDLAGNGVTVTVDVLTGALDVSLDLAQSLTKQAQINLSLADWVSAAGGVNGLDGVGDFIGDFGSAAGLIDLAITGAFGLDLGLNITDPAAGLHVYDTTDLTFTADANATNLNLDASIGVIGLAVINGVLRLNNGDASPAPATFTVGLPAQPNGRVALTDLATLTPTAETDAALYVDLPLTGSLGGQLGDLTILIEDITDVAGTVQFISVPSLDALLGNLDLTQDLTGLIAPLADLLAQYAESLDLGVLSDAFPILGDALQGVANSIGDFQTIITDGLNDAADGAAKFGIAEAQSAIQTALNNWGATAVNVTLDGDADEVIAQITFDQSLTRTASLASGTLGLPALNIELSGDLEVTVASTLDITLGISRDAGVFLVTDGTDPELSIDVSAALNGVELAGRLGFVDVAVKAQPGSTFDAGLSIDLLDPNGNDGRATLAEASVAIGTGAFNDLILAQLGTNAPSSLADLNLLLCASATDWLPAIETELHINWPTSGDGDLAGGIPDIQFVNAGFRLGDTLDKFFGPFFDAVSDAITPIQPIIDLLQTELPIISDFVPVEDQPFTLLSALSLGGDIAGFGKATEFIESAAQVVGIVSSISNLVQSGADGFVGFGDLQFGGTDLRTPDAPDFDLDALVTPDSASPASQFYGTAESLEDEVDEAAARSSGEFAIPLIENPFSVFELLLGLRDDVELITYQLPDLEVGIGFGFDFPIPALPILSVGFFGRLNLTTHIGLGYDTKGMVDFLDSRDAGDLLGGLYISDRQNADGTGPDVPEIALRGEVGANFGLDVFIAEAKIEGGIFTTLTGDLVDDDNDGKVRGTELLEGCFLDAFEFTGELGVFAEVYAKVGLKRFDYPLAEATLLEFGADNLCTLLGFNQSGGNLASVDGDTLILNVGARDNFRNVGRGNVTENYVVRKEGNQFVVEAFGVEDRYSATGITTLQARFGDGNDSLVVEPGVGLIADIDGGAGDDTLDATGTRPRTINGTTYSNLVLGGAGNDTITGSNALWTFTGANFGDVLDGGAGDDLIFGLRGDDTLNGGLGNDVLDGGDDDDVLQGFEGRDTLRGGKGEDYLSGGDGNDRLEGGDGDDEIFGGSDDDAAFGGAGDDEISGDSGADVLFGDAGVDTITGGTQADALYGGDDGDFLFGNDGADYIEGNGGDDFVDGGNQADIVFGGDGNDDLFGWFGADYIDGEAGADDIWGGGQADELLGGDGNDEVHGEGGHDVIDGGANNDDLFGEGGEDTIEGGSGADLIYGGDDDDTITGGTQSDEIYGEAGADLLRGGAGNDTIDGGTEDDAIFGGTGDDTIFGRTGDDTVDGGDGHDLIWTHQGADYVDGGDGDDTIKTGSGNDEAHGQGGNDLIVGFTGGDLLFGDAGDDVVIGGPGFDELYGGADDDRLQGNEGDDQAYGGSGSDILRGGAGSDTLGGGTGDDEVHGEAGRDNLAGDDGDDFLNAGLGIGNVLLGGDGDDTIIGADLGEDDPNPLDAAVFGDVIFAGPGDDHVYGLAGADYISGDAGDDHIDGGAHGDYLLGLGGDDMILGHSGDDQVFGGFGHDELRGEAGNDTIDGGAGDDLIVAINGDTIEGRAGNDTIEGSTDAADTIHAGAGDDHVWGFAGNDTIDGGEGDDSIDGGPGADVLIGGPGSDHLVGGADDDDLYGHAITPTDDDNATDYLFGDFGDDDTTAPGAGDDVLDGDGGYDFLYGEGDSDTINENGLANVVDFGNGLTAGEVASQFTPANPTPIDDANEPRDAEANLTTGPTIGLPWSDLAGSASELGVTFQAAEDPAVVTHLGDRYAAWADRRTGRYEVYVAKFESTTQQWSQLGTDSAAGRGVSASDASSREPALQVISNVLYLAYIDTADDGGRLVIQSFDLNNPSAEWENFDTGNATSFGLPGQSGDIAAPKLDTSFAFSNAANAPGPFLVVSFVDREPLGLIKERILGTAWATVEDPNNPGDSRWHGAGVMLQSLFGFQSYGMSANSHRIDVVASDGAIGSRTVRWATSFSSSGVPGTPIYRGTLGSDNTNPTIVALDHGSIADSQEKPRRIIAWQSEDEDGSQVHSSYFWFDEDAIDEDTGDKGVWETDVRATGQFYEQVEHDENVSNTLGHARQPSLASVASFFELRWIDDAVHQDHDPRASVMRMTGAIDPFDHHPAFDEALPGQANGKGLYQGHIQAFDAKSFVADTTIAMQEDGRGFPTVSVIATGSASTVVRGVVEPGQDIGQAVDDAASPGVVLVMPGEYEGFQIKNRDVRVVAYDPTDPPIVAGLVEIDGDGITLQGLELKAGVAVNSSDVILDANTIRGDGVLIFSGTRVVVSNNTIEVDGTGVAWGQAHPDSQVVYNDITAGDVGIDITRLILGRVVGNRVTAGNTGIRAAFFTPLNVRRNEVYNSGIGVDFAAPVLLADNNLHNNTIGLRVAAGNTATGVGYGVVGSPNHIHHNTTGVLQVSGRLRGQRIDANDIGIDGGAVVGGHDTAYPNVITNNGVGIRSGGDLQFNVLRGNTIGLQPFGGQAITHNIVTESVDADLLAIDATDLVLEFNTFRSNASLGSIVLTDSGDFTLDSSIVVNRSHPAVVMNDASTLRLRSSHNTLHATGAPLFTVGAAEYTYATDWNALFDDPFTQGPRRGQLDWAAPAFRAGARGDVSALPHIGGQRRTSPTLFAGNPATAVNSAAPNQGALGDTTIQTAGAAPYIRLISPIDGDDLPPTSATVTWETQGVAAAASVRLNVYLQSGNGNLFRQNSLTRTVPNTGSYTYTGLTNPDLIYHVALAFDAAVMDLGLTDRAAPVPTFDGLITNDRTPELTGNLSEAATSVTVTVDGTAYTADHTDTTWTLSADDINFLDDDTYDVTVATADALGNTTQVTFPDSLTIDTVAPEATVPSFVTTDPRPLISGTIDDPTATLLLYAGDATDFDSVPVTNHGDGTWSFTPAEYVADLFDGFNVLILDVTDQAGNANTFIGDIELDRDAPDATADTLLTNDPTPRLTGTVNDPDADVTVLINGQTVAANLHAGGTWSVPGAQVNALADGAYPIGIQSTDALGNTATTPNAGTVTVDTAAPVVTVRALTTNDKTPNLIGDLDDPNATIRVTVAGKTYAATAISGGRWSVPGTAVSALQDGTYDVTVRAIDAAGNQSTLTAPVALTIDTVTPTVTLDALATTDPTPTLTGTVNEPLNAFLVTIDGLQVKPEVLPDGRWRISGSDWPAPLNDGVKSVRLEGEDLAGNPFEATLSGLLIDTTAPTTTVDSLQTSDPRPTITGTVDDPDATVRVRLAGRWYAATNAGDGTWSVPGSALAADLPLGTYDARVQARDVLGNASDATFSAVVTVAEQQDAIFLNAHVFYNHSAFDGNDDALGTADDAAIDYSKRPLYDGQRATFENYTSYANGLNGIMLDLLFLASEVTTSDFVFRAGQSNQPDTWALAPTPSGIDVRFEGGDDGADRIALAWTNGSLTNTWLEVTLLANDNTGLDADATFYFGNAIGETGNSPFDARVNTLDYGLVRANLTPDGQAATLTSAYDINRDNLVDQLDLDLVITHQSGRRAVPILDLRAPTVGSGSLGPAGAVTLGTGTAFTFAPGSADDDDASARILPGRAL